MGVTKLIKEIAELKGIKLTDKQAHELRTKLVNTHIDGLLDKQPLVEPKKEQK